MSFASQRVLFIVLYRSPPCPSLVVHAQHRKREHGKREHREREHRKSEQMMMTRTGVLALLCGVAAGQTVSLHGSGTSNPKKVRSCVCSCVCRTCVRARVLLAVLLKHTRSVCSCLCTGALGAHVEDGGHGGPAGRDEVGALSFSLSLSRALSRSRALAISLS